MNPGQSECHAGYSFYLASIGRVDEAVPGMRHALELNPLSSFICAFLGKHLTFIGQFEEAIEILQKMLEIDSNNPFLLDVIAMAYVGKGMYNKSISLIQGLRNIPSFTAHLGYYYSKAGKIEEAQKILDDFLDRSKRGYFSPFMIAVVYNGLGEKDKVFEWLDRAFDLRDIAQYHIKVDIYFDNLHSDPRWTEQLKRRGLAD